MTQIPYERIVISGKGYLSTETVKLLTDHNVNIILTDTYGNLVTAMHKVMSSPTATTYRMAQYDTFRNPEKVATLQRQTLKAKLESQIRFLQSIHRPEVQEVIDGLSDYSAKIDTARDKRDLLTIEARAGYQYFRNYARLFDRKYGFVSRNGGGIKTGNRYASDPINGLLNYGYTVLAGEIAKYVNGLGLDPYYGFFHVTHSSFQALVYDLIEHFRWLVEYAVYKLAVDEPQHGRMIRKDEYAWTREGRIVLDDGLIRRFLEILERRFQSERPYKFKHGIKRRDGLSMCQEITKAKISV